MAHWHYYQCLTVLYGCPYIDVFGQGVWLQMKDIEDAELKELASSLPGSTWGLAPQNYVHPAEN